MKYSLVTILAFLAATSSVAASDVVYPSPTREPDLWATKAINCPTDRRNYEGYPSVYMNPDGKTCQKKCQDFGLKVRKDGKRCSNHRTIEMGWAQAETDCIPADTDSNDRKMAYRYFVQMNDDGKTCKKHCVNTYKYENPDGRAKPVVSWDGANCDWLVGFA